MSVKGHRFTPQFKAKLAMEAIKGQRTVGDRAGMYEAHSSRIAAWKTHLVENLTAVVLRVACPANQAARTAIGIAPGV
jgi:transposase